MLEKLKSKAQTIDVIEKENVEPVSVDEIEKAIKLIEAAKEIDCDFKVCFGLKKDEFIVDSSGDRLFVCKVRDLEASNLMSGDGVVIKGPNLLEDGRLRIITVHFVYYRK